MGAAAPPLPFYQGGKGAVLLLAFQYDSKESKRSLISKLADPMQYKFHCL